MLIDNLNLNLLRIFESVYRSGSMTKAAKELHMTQSGVSQNIKSLEDVLEVKLFDRVRQRPIPTEMSHQLYKVCSQGLLQIEDALTSITGADKELSGQLKIGMPVEFGNNVILPLIAKWGKMHPKIRFHLHYGHISGFYEMIMRGEIDIAFADNFRHDRGLFTEKIADETLVLVGSREYIKEKGPVKNNRKFFETLDYIDYMEDYPILKQWFNHHFPGQKIEGEVRAALMDVQGCARMIVHGLGVGILPLHVVKRLQERGHDLYLFKGSGKPLHNPISLVYLEGKTHSKMALETIKFLQKNLKKA